jgi:hypothetical protein
LLIPYLPRARDDFVITMPQRCPHRKLSRTSEIGHLGRSSDVTAPHAAKTCPGIARFVEGQNVAIELPCGRSRPTTGASG